MDMTDHSTLYPPEGTRYVTELVTVVNFDPKLRISASLVTSCMECYRRAAFT